MLPCQSHDQVACTAFNLASRPSCRSPPDVPRLLRTHRRLVGCNAHASRVPEGIKRGHHSQHMHPKGHLLAVAGQPALARRRCRALVLGGGGEVRRVDACRCERAHGAATAMHTGRGAHLHAFTRSLVHSLINAAAAHSFIIHPAAQQQHTRSTMPRRHHQAAPGSAHLRDVPHHPVILLLLQLCPRLIQPLLQLRRLAHRLGPVWKGQPATAAQLSKKRTAAVEGVDTASPAHL